MKHALTSPGWNKRGIIEQIYKIAKKINNYIERNRYCPTAVINIIQLLVKVWHHGKIVFNLLLTNNIVLIESKLVSRAAKIKYYRIAARPVVLYAK